MIGEVDSQPQKINVLLDQRQFKQQKYRWVILTIAICAMILNGFLNNLIIPIAHKLSVIYDHSQKIVNLPTILSFLVFSIINIPVNHFLDRRGIKTGYLIGLSIYSLGLFLVCFINQAFPMLIVGYIVFSFGQPFILNLPAKIATHWFLPANRAFATSIMVGSGIIGSGLGFAIPTLVVQEDSSGQIAKNQIFSLYFGYAITTLLFLLINILFLKNEPSTPTSNISQKQQFSIKETFVHIKKDKNLWIFFGCFVLIYGSFQTFASSANLLIKPFGVKDIQISIAAIMLILCGATGAVLSSLLLKKTKKYRTIFRSCALGALLCIILLTINLGAIRSVILVQINVGILGFFITPIIPMSFEIGCQIGFPIGEAQVTGLLNGGSLVWAFIADSLLTLIIGFGTIPKAMVFISILILFIAAGNVLAYFLKINLKRTQFQVSKRNSQSTAGSDSPKRKSNMIEMPGKYEENDQNETPIGINKDNNYSTLQEQNL